MRTTATLKIPHIGKVSLAGRRRIAAWLRSVASDIVKHHSKYALALTAKCAFIGLLCASLCGCARWFVPVTNVTWQVGEVKGGVSSPKNYTSTNILVKSTIVDRWGTTNFIELHIGGLAAQMDPTVVQMSGDAFNRALESAIAGALEGAGKAAK